jgi:hypothetical protein
MKEKTIKEIIESMKKSNNQATRTIALMWDKCIIKINKLNQL